jgi:trehalose 6-phosphate phosphatase
VAAWREPLSSALSGAPGVDLEDKKFSIAVHYRAAPSWGVARLRILAATASLPGARVFDGHAVVNIVPADAPTKGDALSDVCRRLGARPAVYIGDDATDEEAFRSRTVAFAIRVGEAEGTAARYSIPDQEAIDGLLRSLIAERTEQDGLGNRWEALVRVMSA